MGLVTRRFVGYNELGSRNAKMFSFDKPMCSICTYRWDTQEEADACHNDEVILDIARNIEHAMITGRIGGRESCVVCGMTHHTRMAADGCCQKGGSLDGGQLRFKPYFGGFYFRVNNLGLVLADWRDLSHLLGWSEYKTNLTLDRVVITRKLRVLDALRFKEATGKIWRGFEYHGFFNKGEENE
jgi:hypothetical protein